MEIHREDFDEHSDPDANGLYEWRYVGTSWRFVDAGLELCFRRYADEPTVATLISPPGWRPDVFASALFQQTRAWLRAHEQIEIVQVYHPPTGTFRPLVESLAAARALGLSTAPLDDIASGTA